MKLLNRMIHGVKNWVTGDTPENRTDDFSHQINHKIQRPTSQVCYRSREEAIEAAKAEIDAKLKGN